MHTTRINKTSFIHYSDFGGDVEIVRGKERLTIPADDLRGFIAEMIRSEKIERLESASIDELLGWPHKP